MNNIYVTIGLPASGKSTWAKQLVEQRNKNGGKSIKRVNKDDLRAMLDVSHWSKSNERFVLKVRDEIITQALREGSDVIVDDTNLATKHLDTIREIARKNHAHVEIVSFTDVPLEECIARDKKRPNYVGEEVIRRMYRDYLEPKENKVQAPAYDLKLEDCIICDLDGTVAKMNGKRGPYEEAKSDQDDLNVPVADIVKLYAKQGVKIIFCSGRDEGRGRDATVRWLAKHGFTYHALLMRKAGDQRKDSVIKEELYREHILGKFNVKFCLDDRNQVVDLWRKTLGLTALQVDYGDF